MRDLNTTLKTTASWSFRKLCTGRSPQLSRASAHGCRPCAVTPLATAKHMDTFVLIAQKKKTKQQKHLEEVATKLLTVSHSTRNYE